MTLPDDAQAPPPEGLLDVRALQRRVLLTGLLALGSFVAIGVLVEAVGAPQWYLLVGMVVVWLLVVRPLMRPVRAAVALRRRLAYAAFLEQRQHEGSDG